MRTGGTSPLTSPQWYITDFSVYIVLFGIYSIYLFQSSVNFFTRQIHNCIELFSLKSVLLSPWLIIVRCSVINSSFFSISWDQALDLLVSVSSTHCCAYTPDLSTSSSLRGLTILWYGISYLEVSFTLRCFQRLSSPHFAILPCRWRDNRCTIGAFIPVLSY